MTSQRSRSSSHNTCRWLHHGAGYKSAARKTILVLLQAAQQFHFQVDWKDSEGLTAFEAALQELGEDDYIVEAFLDSGTILPPNALETAVLSCAGDEENASHVELVLSRGAALTFKDGDDDGFTALHMSALKGALYAALVILRHPGGINLLHSADEEGRAPLHCAAESGNIKMVKLFLENGADMNAWDKTGRSALGEAVTQGHEVLTSALLFQKADINLQIGEYAGGSILHFAISQSPRVSKSMLVYLLSADQEDEDDEDVRFPLLHGQSVLNATDAGGNSALHWAAYFGDFAGVFALTRAGATTGAKNNDGHTALEKAKQRLELLDPANEIKEAAAIGTLRKVIMHLSRINH